jgi:uncharacterized protein
MCQGTPPRRRARRGPRQPAGRALLKKDFPYSILTQLTHRPWAIPNGPWIMTQSWHDLLLAHWPISPELLREKVPAALSLDLFDGQAWLGVVPFHMTNVSPRWVPSLPFVSEFPELNVRTYVSSSGKPGVYFFSLDAASVLAVVAARTLFNLPYHAASMSVEVEADGVRYRSRRKRAVPGGAAFEAAYRPTGPVRSPQTGTLEYFLTERYCLYAETRSGRVGRLDIHHPPWPIQPAEAEIVVNTMADASGIRLPETKPLLHFAKRLDVVTWGMV